MTNTDHRNPFFILPDPQDPTIRLPFYERAKDGTRISYAQKLKEMHMIYKYDCGINLYTKKCYGDMFIYFPEFNRCVCLEIMGSMDSADYISRASNKFFDYSNAGYLIGEDWFILSSTSHSMPNNATIEQAIINIVSVLCAKYVKEIV